MISSSWPTRWIANIAGAAIVMAAIPTALAQELVLHLDPGQSKATFTLSATAHAVHGTFNLQGGEVHFDPVSGKASGEIVFDATSGQTGNQSRDHKMHKDVLQSKQYPEVTFRPDHAQGTLAAQGESTLQVHGSFGIHGSEHELTVPVQLDLTADKWNASAQFTVPYVTWGMKNPSVFFLKVADTVGIELHCAGTLVEAR
ncbi:MAG: YceI family protein [Terriglobales bacterium]